LAIIMLFTTRLPYWIGITVFNPWEKVIISPCSDSESLPPRKINQFLAARRVMMVFIHYFFGRFSNPPV